MSRQTLDQHAMPEQPVSDAAVTVEFVPSFAGVSPAQWQHLLARGDSNVVFLTRESQRTWWDVYGRGRLLLAAVRRGGDIVALAPLFADESGMVYFVGSGGCGSDYLDFVGDISNPEILDTLLGTIRQHVEPFVGFRFYFVPERSRTGGLLRQAAERLGLDLCDEGAMAAPVLNLDVADAAEAAVNKKSLRQSERFFERTGGVSVREMRTGEDILPYLDDFFSQHIDRWQPTRFPSLFLEEEHRNFYKGLVREASDAGWLRFTRLEWRHRAIAMHFGFCYSGSYTYYKPTFLREFARHSPGHVLLRRLLLSAMSEGARKFDFGLGDEPYKQRFGAATRLVNTWGLYARGRKRDFVA